MSLPKPTRFFAALLLFAAIVFCVLEASAAEPTAVPASPSSPSGVPTLFILGDSTANNNVRGQQGWGTPLTNYFDPAKVRIANRGHAGTSSRSFYNGDWPRVLPDIRPGDYALLVFGINDGLGSFNGTGATRSSLTGIGDETQLVNEETVHTYGWYMAQMASDAKGQGAKVYLLTVTARNIWTNPHAKFNDATITSKDESYNPGEDRIERGTANGRYTQWTLETAARLHLPALDLTNLQADKFDKLGREQVMVNYADHNHTYPAGADLVAATIVSGLKAFQHSPFTPLLSDQGRALETADVKYVRENAAGPIR